MSEIYRCKWAQGHPLLQEYHDKEWGVPLHDDHRLFEYLVLDSFQAGLNWLTILKKRENFRKAFDNFDFVKIASYDENKINLLLNDDGIIKNKLKIESAVINAQAFIKVIDEFGSFDKYIWKFVNYQSIINSFEVYSQIPQKTRESDAMSRDLKKRGFVFLGSTICYAFMQAAGMVNDHEIHCFRYNTCIVEQAMEK